MQRPKHMPARIRSRVLVLLPFTLLAGGLLCMYAFGPAGMLPTGTLLRIAKANEEYPDRHIGEFCVEDVEWECCTPASGAPIKPITSSFNGTTCGGEIVLVSASHPDGVQYAGHDIDYDKNHEWWDCIPVCTGLECVWVMDNGDTPFEWSASGYVKGILPEPFSQLRSVAYLEIDPAMHWTPSTASVTIHRDGAVTSVEQTIPNYASVNTTASVAVPPRYILEGVQAPLVAYSLTQLKDDFKEASEEIRRQLPSQYPGFSLKERYYNTVDRHSCVDYYVSTLHTEENAVFQFNVSNEGHKASMQQFDEGYYNLVFYDLMVCNYVYASSPVETALYGWTWPGRNFMVVSDDGDFVRLLMREIGHCVGRPYIEENNPHYPYNVMYMGSPKGRNLDPTDSASYSQGVQEWAAE